MEYILDICSGSQSLKTLCENNNLKYVSLDINEKSSPEILTNLLEWDYKKYFEDNNKPYFIWFSPPCNEYSLLNNARPNKICDIEGSNKIVKKGLEIIDYCNCKFVIENPDTSTLKNQGILDEIPFTKVDYCSYGFPYKKRTRLWNNIELEGELCKKHECPFKIGKRHIYSIGNSTYKTNVKEFSNKKNRLDQRYAIPPKLIENIKTLII
jgi:hypothetical protein